MNKMKICSLKLKQGVSKLRVQILKGDRMNLRKHPVS